MKSTVEILLHLPGLNHLSMILLWAKQVCLFAARMRNLSEGGYLLITNGCG